MLECLFGFWNKKPAAPQARITPPRPMSARYPLPPPRRASPSAHVTHLVIPLNTAELDALDAIVNRANARDEIDVCTTHGKMTVERLVKLLVEDAIAIERQPGHWEANMMKNTLQAHGYFV